MPQAGASLQMDVPVQPDPVNHNSSAHAPNPNWRAGFWALIVTQFQGAFSVNAFRYLLSFMILARPDRDKLVSLVGLFFAVPFILFSMAGGFLADRFSKRQVTITTKIMELGAMTLAVAALQTQLPSFELAILFLISAQAALFGPSKYGLLPELLPEKWLSWGNGVIELGTFLAVMSATVASGFLAFYFRGHQERSGIALLACTLLGLAASFGISRVPAANPARKFNSNPLGDLGEQ